MQSTFVRYIYKVIVFVAGDWQKENGEKELGWVGGRGFFYVCWWVGLFKELLASSSICDEGRGPFSQLLVSSLSPPGMTAEAVAALRRPALWRQWRETNLTHGRLWGPSRSLPTAQANRDEFVAAVGVTYLLTTLQCY